MNVIGKWKFKGINMPTADGHKLYTIDNIDEDENVAEVFEENKGMILEFLEDGTLNTLLEATEENIAMAAEAGVEPREDGYIVGMESKWEDRNGVIYYESSVEGTIMDQEIDPWMPLTITDDGCILYNFDMILFEHI